MLVDHLSTVAPASILIAGFVLIACAAVLLFNRFGHGINHIPGPSLWATTDFFRLFDAWGRRPDITQINLHKKYGSFVRMGPNCVSISDPEALKILYGFNSGFIKVRYDFKSLIYTGISRPQLVRLLRCIPGNRQGPGPTQHG